MTIFNFDYPVKDNATVLSDVGALIPIPPSSIPKLTCLLDELKLDELAEEEITKTSKHVDKIRGPVQRHFGFASNYSLTRLPENEGGHVYPRVLGDGVPPKWSERFRTMTLIADHIYNEEGGKAIKGNPDFELYFVH